MYQYQIFPFVIYQEEPLEHLPVEMFAAVLRHLDGVSLLNAANASKRLMQICRGDPILRQRVHEQLKRNVEARRRFMLNPGASVTVERQQKGGLFQRNVKQVKKKQWDIETNIGDLWTTKRAGAVKAKTKSARTVPYKCVRL